MKLSLITATFNTLPGLQDTRRQVLAQTGAEIEHVVVDGASTDGTVEWLNKRCKRGQPVNCSILSADEMESSKCYNSRADPFCWISEPDRGLYDALNKGFALATGDVLGILHSDDLLAHEGILGRVLDTLERSGADACYGDLVYVEAGDTSKVRRRWISGPYDVRAFRKGWMPPHPTLFVRREAYEKVGPYRLDLGSAADYEWMLRACVVHGLRLAYIPEVMVRMRVGGASNRSVRNRLQAHGHDHEAWRVNGLRPAPWTLPMKVLRKIPQWFRR